MCHDAHPLPVAEIVNVACGVRDKSRLAALMLSVAGPAWTAAEDEGCDEDAEEDPEAGT
jgi:hypothetical protein